MLLYLKKETKNVTCLDSKRMANFVGFFVVTFCHAEITYFWRVYIVGSCRMLLYMCILLCPKIALSICKAQFSIIAFESWKVSPRLLLSHREIRILSKCVVVEFKKYRISVVNSYVYYDLVVKKANLKSSPLKINVSLQWKNLSIYQSMCACNKT